MRFDTRSRSSASLFYQSFPPGVKWLIIANVAVYVIYFFGSLLNGNGEPIFQSLQLIPFDVVRRGEIWQLVTYLFLHSLTDYWHIILNMLALWMFGAPVEQTWGTRRFVQYYFVCGVGAGVCVVLANLAFGDMHQSTIGASGAIYGLLLAFGMLFPEQEVLLMFLIPVKAKVMVMIFGAIVFFGSFHTSGPVSNLAHLGGMVVGYFYIKTQFSVRASSRASRIAKPSFSVSGWWREYKLQRAKRKFQVYMKKHGPGPGSGVN